MIKRSKNTFLLWSGVIVAALGAVLVYLGIHYTDMPSSTYVQPGLISGGLFIIGGVLIGVGLVRILFWLLGMDSTKKE